MNFFILLSAIFVGSALSQSLNCTSLNDTYFNITSNMTMNCTNSTRWNITIPPPDLYSMIIGVRQSQVLGITMIWLLFGGFFVFLMQGGLSLWEVGCVASGNLMEILLRNLLNISVAALVFWIVGFGVAFGYKDNQHQNGFIGTGSILLVSDGYFPGKGYGFGHWVFQWSYAALTTTIMFGGMTERTIFHAYPVLTFWMTGWTYPIVAHWVWGRSGWLSSLANCLDCSPVLQYSIKRLGKNGMLDVAGSGVVHIVGGFAALMGSYMLGPRTGRFAFTSPMYKPEIYERGNLLHCIFGVFILWFGFFGYNCAAVMGISRSVDSDQVGRAAINTILCAATCGLMAMPVSRYLYGKYDVTMVLNGFLAGLVSIAAGCSLVEPFAAVCIGVVGFGMYFLAHLMLLRIEIDDPLDTFAIHGACGVWGCIAVGLISTEDLIMHTYGTRTGKYGWLYGGGLEQLGVQFIGVCVIAGWSSFMSWVALYVIRRRWLWMRFGLRIKEGENETGTAACAGAAELVSGATAVNIPPQDKQLPASSVLAGSVVNQDIPLLFPKVEAATAASTHAPYGNLPPATLPPQVGGPPAGMVDPAHAVGYDPVAASRVQSTSYNYAEATGAGAPPPMQYGHYSMTGGVLRGTQY